MAGISAFALPDVSSSGWSWCLLCAAPDGLTSGSAEPGGGCGTLGFWHRMCLAISQHHRTFQQAGLAPLENSFPSRSRVAAPIGRLGRQPLPQGARSMLGSPDFPQTPRQTLATFCLASLPSTKIAAATEASGFPFRVCNPGELRMRQSRCLTPLSISAKATRVLLRQFQ